MPSVKEATQGHALLVRPGQMSDAIAKILPNKKLLEDMADSAYTFATQQRTWAQTIEKTVLLYEGIL